MMENQVENNMGNDMEFGFTCGSSLTSYGDVYGFRLRRCALNTWVLGCQGLDFRVLGSGLEF